jgi:methylenetetrahydrofolate dehydrogenase (NADP+) / methenyltetrahydrofolate cyclohydrolase
MAIIFDGRGFAAGIEAGLKLKIARLKKKPKLVTICNPQDPPSRIYSKIKSAKAAELGVIFEQYDIASTTDPEGLVTNLSKDSTVDGLMIQLPLTGDRAEDMKLCQLINPKKDADGLNLGSGVMQATVRAVMAILEEGLKVTEAFSNTPHRLPPKLGGRAEGGINIAVVGSDGVVGRGITRELDKNLQFTIYNLGKYNFDAEKIRQADVVISATGQEGLIKPEFVKPGVIAIDVGYPHGDFDPSTALRASFFTPVPGGVGPVTVAMLFANLIDLVNKG